MSTIENLGPNLGAKLLDAVQQIDAGALPPMKPSALPETGDVLLTEAAKEFERIAQIEANNSSSVNATTHRNLAKRLRALAAATEEKDAHSRIRWRFIYQHENGSEYSGLFPSKEAAEKERADMLESAYCEDVEQVTLPPAAESKLTELERENRELREHHQRDEAMIVQRTDEVRQLRTETAELREDKARMDWLEDHVGIICYSGDEGELPDVNVILPNDEGYYDIDNPAGTGATIREAMDAARNGGAT